MMLLTEHTDHRDYERALPVARRLLLLLGGDHAFAGEIAPEPDSADNDDSVKLDTVDLIEAFVRDMESASLADFSNDERKQQVKRAVQMLRHVADDCTFGAVLKALGAPDEGDDNENAVAPPGNEPDSVKREELAALETEFEAAGGRGVELADRIDALRAEVAIEQAVAGMPEHPCIERSGTADAPWWVWIPPRGPQDFDADEWSILGPYGGTYWPTFDEAVEFMRRTTSDPVKLPADVVKRLDRFKQEHPDLVLDPTKNEDALRKLLADWFDAEMFRISETGSSADWQPLIDDAKARHATFGIPWSNAFVPDYVREILAMDENDVPEGPTITTAQTFAEGVDAMDRALGTPATRTDVLVLTIDHHHGFEVSVHRSRKAAMKELFAWVDQSWSTNGPVGDDMPDDTEAAIKAYFDFADETYHISPTALET